MNSGDLNYILKRFALFAGIILAIFSIWFSWDGLDQTVTGNNPNYSEMAKFAGAVLAIVMTLLQFIFNTSFHSLSLTLKIAGFMSYIYSIYTNYLGIGHIFGFPEWISAFLAVGMDVLPESMISWSMDEHTRGDFLGNLMKAFMGTPPSQRGGGGGGQGKHQKQAYTFTPTSVEPTTQPKMPAAHNQPKKGQGRKFHEGNRNQGQHGQGKPYKPPFAGLFEDDDE